MTRRALRRYRLVLRFRGACGHRHELQRVPGGGQRLPTCGCSPPALYSDQWRAAPWADQTGDGSAPAPVAKSERRVVGEDIMDGAARRLQAAEPGLSYEQAYAKALDTDPVAQLAYTVGNHRKPSGTAG
jgi:hypothetical protein